jgi:hypothetical protein
MTQLPLVDGCGRLGCVAVVGTAGIGHVEQKAVGDGLAGFLNEILGDAGVFGGKLDNGLIVEGNTKLRGQLLPDQAPAAAEFTADGDYIIVTHFTSSFMGSFGMGFLPERMRGHP